VEVVGEEGGEFLPPGVKSAKKVRMAALKSARVGW
jgi:hypothetical protein